MKKENMQYHDREMQEIDAFIGQMGDNVAPGGTFDSAAAVDFVSGAMNQNAAPMPVKLQSLFDELKEDERAKVTRALFDGIGMYETAHGIDVPADVVKQAIHSAYATTDDARNRFALDSVPMNSATSAKSENQSLQPNRAIVAILSALGEAIPWAHYLPADIGSNEAKLAILSHIAGNEYGQYAQSGLMDGTLSGDAYITSSRVHKATRGAESGYDTHSGQLTSVQSDHETCAAVGGNSVAVKLMRGRSIVYVNGIPVAAEVSSSGSGVSTVSGSVTISGTTHQIGGTINTDTGVIALTSTPGLGASVPVHVEGFIDYERAPELTPSIITAVETFPFYAKPWRVITQTTIDSRTQMSNELGLDPYSEAVIAIQAQYGNERHYDCIRKAMRLGANNTDTFDMDWANVNTYKNRADVLADFLAKLAVVSQKMAEDTLSHGITHLYGGKNFVAQLRGMPRDVFQPSGVAERPGIYRVGRLFNQYEVYYTPKGLTDSTSATQVLAVGRANDVTRNPIVLGDAVSPTVIPLAVNSDLRAGAGFYARNFTEVNKHAPSAKGCAIINLTNMGM